MFDLTLDDIKNFHEMFKGEILVSIEMNERTLDQILYLSEVKTSHEIHSIYSIPIKKRKDLEFGVVKMIYNDDSIKTFKIFDKR